MKPELFWISGPWRGKLAIASRPRGGDWLQDEAVAWRRAGLDVVVSLLEDEEAAQLELAREAEAARREGIDFIRFPIADRGVPDSTAATLALLHRTVEALNAGKHVAVHCRQGIGRSGLIAVGALITSGFGTEEAINAVSLARGVLIPETQAQHEWLQHLPAEHPAEKFSD
ncbi:MAG: sulfur transferase domain-containing protein [Bryobacteraceae bacterium]|jgi:protein-tyrosine phosphatase